MVKTILHVLSSEKYFNDVIKILKKTNEKVVYVTTNKPYEHLINLLKKAKIKTERFYFVDCISKYVSPEKMKKTKNCIFLESPGSVTDMAIAIDKAIGLVPGEKLVMLDSLSTLLIYNNETVVEKFSNFLVNRLRALNVSAMILTVDTDVDKDAIKVIESFVDVVEKHAG